MLAQERYEIIKQLLLENKVIKVSEMMERFDVSIETVRRDFEYLEKQGFLKRVYGGAVLSTTSGIEPDYSTRSVNNLEQKRAIGKKAAEFINDGDTIIIDLGTTTLEVAKNLTIKRDLTVITNSIRIALELIDIPGNRVFLAGGLLRKAELATSGFLTEGDLKYFNVDKSIIGVGGITIQSGITDYHVEEAQVRRIMVDAAQKIIAVADYSKFGVKALNRICGLDKVDIVVTDWNVDKQTLDQYKKNNIRIEIAQPE